METGLFLIQIAVAANMIIFGVDQLLHPERWIKYIPSWIKSVIPMSDVVFMKAHAVGNVALGVLFAAAILPTIVPWVVFAWFLTIAIGAFSEDWTIGVRDSVITLAVLAYCLLI